jgi:hypothetical protein
LAAIFLKIVVALTTSSCRFTAISGACEYFRRTAVLLQSRRHPPIASRLPRDGGIELNVVKRDRFLILCTIESAAFFWGGKVHSACWLVVGASPSRSFLWDERMCALKKNAETNTQNKKKNQPSYPLGRRHRALPHAF